MSQYTVIQDIEAEDKFVGPLTLKQFIFAAGAVVLLYLSFILVSKHVWPLSIPLLIPACIAIFLAFPWGRDQPTEIWLLAKIRFALKPRRRIWDQTGLQELVTITAPKKVDTQLTNGLDETQVKSRLQTLAQTIDTRGWAIKGVPTNLNGSDRLIDASTFHGAPATTLSDVGVADMLDVKTNPVAIQMDQLVKANDQQHRQALIDRMDSLRTTPPVISPATDHTVSPPDLPFVGHQSQHDAYGQTPVLKPLAKPAPAPPVAPINTPQKPAILDLAHNDDLSVATIARQANKENHLGDDEVVISLR